MEYRYQHPTSAVVVTVEAEDEAEAHEALAEIVAKDFADTSESDWQDAQTE